jgi:hypothetical protein
MSHIGEAQLSASSRMTPYNSNLLQRLQANSASIPQMLYLNQSFDIQSQEVRDISYQVTGVTFTAVYNQFTPSNACRLMPTASGLLAPTFWYSYSKQTTFDRFQALINRTSFEFLFNLL